MKYKELKHDIILENFRQNNKKLPRIYCDMDGVLCTLKEVPKRRQV